MCISSHSYPHPIAASHRSGPVNLPTCLPACLPACRAIAGLRGDADFQDDVRDTAVQAAIDYVRKTNDVERYAPTPPTPSMLPSPQPGVTISPPDTQ